MKMLYDVADGGHFGKLQNFCVGGGVSCGVEYFCVEIGLDVGDFAKAVGLECIQSVKVVVCEAG